MLDIQVGDTVKFKDAIVTKVNGNFVTIKFYDDTKLTIVYRQTISEAIKPPWEPVVGETIISRYTRCRYEYRGMIDNQWVIRNSDGKLFVTTHNIYDKVP